MPKNRIPGDLQVWIDARRKFHLSHAHVQMARELGMNPKKLDRFNNHKQEKWKLPLPLFIEECKWLLLSVVCLFLPQHLQRTAPGDNLIKYRIFLSRSG